MFLPLALAAGLAAAPPPPRLPRGRVSPRRATTLWCRPTSGRLWNARSRAAPTRRAIAADAELRWSDAEALYREAAAEWTAAARLRPSRALELAITKAERERTRSQALASRARAAATRTDRDPGVTRNDALEEGRLLRAKLMATRAVLERVPGGALRPRAGPPARSPAGSCPPETTTPPRR